MLYVLSILSNIWLLWTNWHISEMQHMQELFAFLVVIVLGDCDWTCILADIDLYII